MGKGSGTCVRPAMNAAAVALPSEHAFRLVNCPLGTLVLPKQTKWQWADDERWYRSLLLSPENEVISVGFPKFGNWDEPSFLTDRSVIEKQIQTERAVSVTDKIDGSLIIRSVYQGEVLWRTRGNWHLGSFKEPTMQAAAAYGVLHDPTVAADQSLLFELTHPDHAVVLKYDKPDLTFLGAVQHAPLRLYTREELETFAGQYNLSLVKEYPAPTSPKQLVKEVKRWQGKEGVVARSVDGQHLIKIKSLSYLALHRMKQRLTPHAVHALLLDNTIDTIDEWEALLKKQGADWESYQDTMPLVDSLLKTKTEANSMMDDLNDRVDLVCIANVGKRDAQRDAINNTFALSQREAALLLLDGNEKGAYGALHNALMTEVVENWFDESGEQD